MYYKQSQILLVSICVGKNIIITQNDTESSFVSRQSNSKYPTGIKILYMVPNFATAHNYEDIIRHIRHINKTEINSDRIYRR